MDHGEGSSDPPRGLDERARLAAIVDSSDDAIVSKTLDGVIMSWNRAAERMFGWTAAEAVGRHITLIIPPERYPEEDDVLARIRRGDGVDHFETIRVTKDGRLLNISLTVSPVRDASGRIVGASKIARDVTERKRLEADRDRLLTEAQNARKEAETANRTKDQLLAIVSHEIRTPLNAMLGYANMLQRGVLDEEAQERALDIIIRNGTALAQLVDDLLDLSRVVAGRMLLKFEPCDFSAVVADAVETVRPAADAKGVSLAAALAPGTVPVVGAPDRLRQIVLNLLTNAVKFTPAGGRINVAVVRAEGTAQLTVSDDGAGIGAEALPHIFEQFRQEDSSTTRPHSGLGLGLALVKHLVELHGGAVQAESPGKGQGATFTVTVPLAALPVAGAVSTR